MWQSILDDSERYGTFIPTRRLSALVDGNAYFQAFMAFARRAKHRIFIMGWDFDTRLILVPAGDHGPALTLGAFLESLLLANPALEIKVLCWDFAAVYLMERELFPSWAFSPAVRDRISIRYDGHHLAGASQHQKVVVVDNAAVFVGGIDFGVGRHDSRAHAAEDPLRDSGFAKSYPPVHDVQLVLEGADIVRWFETLALARWELSTGQNLAPLPDPPASYWPAGLATGLTDVPVLVSLTRPPFAGHPGCFQIRELLKAALACARHLVYVENQYFTSQALFTAMAEALRARPELCFLFVLPSHYHGRAEEHVIGYRQRVLLKRLRDIGGPGRVWASGPVVRAPQPRTVSIHSKIMMVDDAFLTIGSANFNNRSMGLDFEVNVSLFAHGAPAVRAFIAGLRDDLVREHAGWEEHGPPLPAAEDGRGYLRAVREARAPHRGLKALPLETKSWERFSTVLMPVVDAMRPLPPALFLQKLFRDFASPLLLKPLSSMVLSYVTMAALAGLYVLARPFPNPFTAGFLPALAAALFLPFNLNAGIFFAGAQSSPTAWLTFFGATAASLAVAWALGRVAARAGWARWYRRRYDSLFAQEGLKDQSTWSLAVLRHLPLLPFTAFNAVAAAFGVRAWRLAASAFLSLWPSFVGMAVVMAFLRWPSWRDRPARESAEVILALVAVGVAAVVLTRAFHRRRIHARSLVIGAATRARARGEGARPLPPRPAYAGGDQAFRSKKPFK